MQFMEDTKEGLELAKQLSQNGYKISPFLAEISQKLLTTSERLDVDPNRTEQQLVEFIAGALQDINVTRYIEKLEHDHELKHAAEILEMESEFHMLRK